MLEQSFETWEQMADRFAAKADELARQGKTEDAHVMRLHVGYCRFFFKQKPTKREQLVLW